MFESTYVRREISSIESPRSGFVGEVRYDGQVLDFKR
jgi:hypothetical protein